MSHFGSDLHRRALQLLAEPVAAGSCDAVLECEARLGLRLPASVREWFGALNGHELLMCYGNQDHGVHRRDFVLTQHARAR